ncbi:Hypothetical predicted protein [Olea europaea subsp. europaea]|uniref:Leucine-rich repeat-containing N-terminal plant-type domain-containing protein n=1 Tax=Olea europaea subsp. europaea TaxID=158383 RepID=A0A8S0TZJ3_OLEEU|nr:Hypothetical predicted protein [Olea europaea subsp. europaea]
MGIKLLAMLVMMLLSLLNGWYCLGCWKEEKVALLHLKANINFPDEELLPSWVVNETTIGYCQWTGVECSNTTKRVIQLDLNGVMERTLGDCERLFGLTKLEVLDFKGNDDISNGDILSMLKLGRLRRLEELFLDFSNVDGNFLQSIGELSSLKILSLSSCRLNGTLPVQGKLLWVVW